METRNGRPVLFFPDSDSLTAWLSENHLSSSGIWIKFAKKRSGIPSATYEEAREAAIRYGWIDGQLHPYDDRFFLRVFTHRKPKSPWSKINRTIAEELIASGQMAGEGLAEVERARSDGRWERAYDAPARMTVPDDFQRELDADRGAAEFFSTVSKANRYAFLYRIHTAGSPALRVKRIARILAMLRAGEVYHPEA